MLDKPIRRRGRKPGQLLRMTCFACGKQAMGRSAAKYARCEPCRKAGRFGELPSPAYDKGGGTRAVAAVAAAVRDGYLSPPAEHQCVDCGAQAQQYDHRDYRKPLVVEPVCRSCNKLRGPAIPLDGSIRARMDDGVIPYSFRSSTEKLFRLLGIPTGVLADMPGMLTMEHWETLLPLVEQADMERASSTEVA